MLALSSLWERMSISTASIGFNLPSCDENQVDRSLSLTSIVTFHAIFRLFYDSSRSAALTPTTYFYLTSELAKYTSSAPGYTLRYPSEYCLLSKCPMSHSCYSVTAIANNFSLSFFATTRATSRIAKCLSMGQLLARSRSNFHSNVQFYSGR